ncbi:uncharacterized protein CLUP02_09582 [Colletotrichum lupini]|uniref:Uncharacterized protein n=1 Tax=Colletotrichum lupini TaxID=145971 RepID=A0A9Q8SWK9_9PEZI|nr:uncharacterized protein CLUP02_09582 [Colletotrichum lupini]UQC84086.1 hypothetical protein CLUP02_09582 [Colletotrichum lupini]
MEVNDVADVVDEAECDEEDYNISAAMLQWLYTGYSRHRKTLKVDLSASLLERNFNISCSPVCERLPFAPATNPLKLTAQYLHGPHDLMAQLASGGPHRYLWQGLNNPSGCLSVPNQAEPHQNGKRLFEDRTLAFQLGTRRGSVPISPLGTLLSLTKAGLVGCCRTADQSSSALCPTIDFASLPHESSYATDIGSHISSAVPNWLGRVIKENDAVIDLAEASRASKSLIENVVIPITSTRLWILGNLEYDVALSHDVTMSHQYVQVVGAVSEAVDNTA